MTRMIVVDNGKTLSKVSLWTSAGELLDRQTRPNAPIEVGGIRRLDVAGVEAWLVEALSRYAGEDVTHIVPVGHGAGVAAIEGGRLAFAPLDYEQPIPPDVEARYARERDPFEMTGSPRLPDGLNMGAQLFWLDEIEAEAMAGAVLLPWAQYWAWFLSGVAASEVTSLGCHSDLWCPHSDNFSFFADRRGWSARFAPRARADAVVGQLRPDLARSTGLPGSARILAGLHDSNAALLAARGFAEIAGREATILSTGTWFVAMRLAGAGAAMPALAEDRDCLINVDACALPVPSARFMGGREIESVIEIDTRRVDIRPDQPRLLAAVPDLLARGAMMLPTLAPGCGPFPGHAGVWIDEPSDWYERRAAMCLYAALVADASLDLIGASGQLLVEGRFAEAEVFVRALASLRPATAIYTANAHNDVSFGALRLVDPGLVPAGTLETVAPLPSDLAGYRSAWRAEIDRAAIHKAAESVRA